MKVEALKFHPTSPPQNRLAKLIALAETSIYKVF